MNDATNSPANSPIHRKNATGRTNRALSLKDTLALIEYMKVHYPTTEVFDPEFAQQASAALGFEVSVSSVQTGRQALGFEATRDRMRRENAEKRERAASGNQLSVSVIQRIMDLERHLAVLQHAHNKLVDRFEVYKSGCRGDHAKG